MSPSQHPAVTGTIVAGVHSVSLFTDDAPRLALFYREVLGLATAGEGDCPIGGGSEKAFDFLLPDGRLMFVVDHSEVRGPNRNPERIIINFATPDLDSVIATLRQAGVRQVGEAYEVKGLGRIATFADPDENFIQLIEPASVH